VSIEVAPDEFRLVEYDATTIADVARRVAELVGAGDRSIRIEIDETTPLARISASTADDGSISVHADSGAFEDSRRPRRLSAEATEIALGRVVMRELDRARPDFAGAPLDHELTLPQLAAWDTACVGRLARLGVRVHQQRWRYNFRNRHGFTDAADAAFERLWSCDQPTWAMITSP
jgi:hypothetical protein